MSGSVLSVLVLSRLFGGCRSKYDGEVIEYRSVSRSTSNIGERTRNGRDLGNNRSVEIILTHSIGLETKGFG